MYKDSSRYFISSELKQFLDGYEDKSKFKMVLEIGSYEGIFSCYAAVKFADIVHTVDPFDVSDEGTRMTSRTESVFHYNIARCPSGQKIIPHKKTSNLFFENNNIQFDFIYVDGSHDPGQTYKDLNNSFKFCNSGGMIWVDDYGSNYKNLHEKIDEWLDENKSNIEIIHKQYQVGMIKK